jgi:hypothetical protein
MHHKSFLVFLARNLCLGFGLGLVVNASAQGIILQESFETGFPAAWTVQRADTTSDGFRWGNSGTLSSPGWTIDVGTNFLATNDDACDCNKSADRLRLPPVALDTVFSARLRARCYFNRATFGGATESASIQASVDGVSWTTIVVLEGDADWQEVLVDLQDYVGLPEVYLSFLYNDGGGWAFGLAVDDVRVFEPAAKDIRLMRIAPDWAYFEAAPTPLKATIRNLGADTLNSCVFAYRVDGGGPVSATLSGFSLSPLDTMTITHPDPWNPSADTARRIVEVTVSDPDGFPDGSPLDNTLAWGTRALDAAWVTERTVLLEHFTSTNSGSAAALNPGYHALVESVAGAAVSVSYHVWWPYTTDPFYTAYPDAAEARVPLYGVSVLPDIRMDGSRGPSVLALSEQAVMARQGRPALFDLQASLEPDSGRYRIHVRAESLVPYWYDEVILHVIILDRLVDGPNTDPFASPESSFRNVVRRMLPNADGTILENPEAGTVYEREWNWNPSPFWSDLSDVAVVAFIQEPTSREVLQSVEYRSPPLGLEALDSERRAMALWPNPVYTEVHVKLPERWTGQWLHWCILDATGVAKDRGIWTDWSSGRTLPVGHLPAGWHRLMVHNKHGESVSTPFLKP